MATITRYVNTASTPGGDGTTNATAGANRAYAALSEFESSEQQDLTDGGGDIMDCICEGSAADSIGVTIDGWTFGSSNYLLIRTTQANRHDGKWNDSKYRLIVDDASCLTVLENYVRVEGIQFRRITSGFASTVLYNFSAVADNRMGYCIVESPARSTVGIQLSGTTSHVVTIYNTVVGPTIWTPTGQRDVGIQSEITTNIYNCTIAVASNGIQEAAAGIVTVKNTTVADCTDDFSFSGSGSIDYCASDDGDETNPQTLSGTRANDFVDFGNDDFHSVSGSVQIDNGVSDPGSGLYSDDIEANSRSGSWDIGAFELAAAVSVTPDMWHPKIEQQYPYKPRVVSY